MPPSPRMLTDLDGVQLVVAPRCNFYTVVGGQPPGVGIGHLRNLGGREPLEAVVIGSFIAWPPAAHEMVGADEGGEEEKIEGKNEQHRIGELQVGQGYGRQKKQSGVCHVVKRW